MTCEGQTLFSNNLISNLHVLWKLLLGKARQMKESLHICKYCYTLVKSTINVPLTLNGTGMVPITMVLYHSTYHD